MTASDALSGPQFHGTKANLNEGDLIEPGHPPNDSMTKPGHVYFTNTPKVAAGFSRGGKVYRVEPTGKHTRDSGYEARPGETSRKSKEPLVVKGEWNDS
jgi:Rifampin ADP-ribosyl transferase